MNPKNRDGQRDSGLTRVEVAVAAAAIALCLVLAVCLVARTREQARRRKCAGNLRQIGIAMVTYVEGLAQDRYYPYDRHGGVASLSILYSDRFPRLSPGEWLRHHDAPEQFPLPPPSPLLSDPSTFICPGTRDPIATTGRLTQKTCSYIGRDPTGGAVDDSAGPGTRMAADDSLDHHGKGCNVLLLDGRVPFVTASDDPTGPPLSATQE